jgi:hypothetical protein
MEEMISRDDDAVVSDGAKSLFEKLSTRLGRRIAPGIDAGKLGYDITNEEIMGYLAHGVAEWHAGDALIGAECLRFFLENAAQVAASTGATTTSLDWIQLYQPMVTERFGSDLDIVRDMEALDPGESRAELQVALKRVKDAREALSSGGTYGAVLESRSRLYQSRLARLRTADQRRRMVEAKELRERELAQLGEVADALPAMVNGYDYSRALGALEGMHFDSPEVQAAVDGRRYLYAEADAFIQQLFEDFNRLGFTGEIRQHNGLRVSGQIVGASLDEVKVAIDRGELQIPTEMITPECFIEIAQKLADPVTDSTDYYRRQERIAVFARINGLQGLSAIVAARLMEENRGFRTRWMRVLQGGI